MKRRIISLVLCLLLLVPCMPVYAAGSEGTELWFSNTSPVCGITAYYDVLTEDVESISVVFDAAIAGNAYANFIKEKNQLRIVVASVTPVDLAKAVGVATATLTNTQTAAPQLKLTSLKYDGESATSNVIPKGVSSEVASGTLTARITLHDDLQGSVKVLVSAYSDDGKYLGMKQETLSFTSTEQTFSVAVGKYQNAATVKVMFLNDVWQPYMKALEGSVQ